MTPEQADQNVRHIRKPLDDYAQGPQETERWHAAVEEMERRARRLLMSCNPPEGHITLPDGRWVKVSGKLPVTADGCVVIPMVSAVFHPAHPGLELDVDVVGDQVVGECGCLQPDFSCEYFSYSIYECYSTRQAAEAAAKEQR